MMVCDIQRLMCSAHDCMHSLLKAGHSMGVKMNYINIAAPLFCACLVRVR